MLEELHVKNLVLIEDAQLEFDSGLNAFTGETGAGKSLLIDALGLLFGGRGDPDAVRPGAKHAEVTARFLLADMELLDVLQEAVGISFEDLPVDGSRKRIDPPVELVVSRWLPRQGRSRAHANGRPIALAALRTLGEHLLDIHGQNENQSLLRPVTCLEILDRYATGEVERKQTKLAFEAARKAATDLFELRQSVRDRQGQEDRFRFQLQELESIELDDLEPARLENERKLLRGAERIQEASVSAVEALDGDSYDAAATLMARALSGLEKLGDVGADADGLKVRLEGLLAETRELARDLAALAEKAEGDPERLEALEDTRATLRALERKHGRDFSGLVAFRNELRSKLSDFDCLDVHFDKKEAALTEANAALKKIAAKLTRKRKAAAKVLERKVTEELKDLGLKGSSFLMNLIPNAGPKSSSNSHERDRLLPAELRATGAESVELLFTANPELPPKPLGECASGGELSRVMLALKGVLAKAGGADRLPVVVFDEVDAGVGGRMGSVLGRKLAHLASVRQVLCVTHLPQVAAYARLQIKIEKKRVGSATVVQVTRIEGDDRVGELAMMLRGDAASKRTRAEAKEMLEAAQLAK